jgi:hypothetical protein
MSAQPSWHRAGAPIAAAGTLALLAGCGGLQVKLVQSAHERPSNVAVYLRVEDERDEPVAGLTANSFRVYEDGAFLPQPDTKQTLVDARVSASHYTLLLVDTSGSVSEPATLQALVQAATAFAERLEKSQNVGAYAFDGSAELHPIAPIPRAGGSASADVKALATFKPADPSTNLNGAVLKGLGGLKELEETLAHAETPMRFGTLVVVTHALDRAGRASAQDVRDAVQGSRHDVFVVGLGSDVKESELRRIGKSGVVLAREPQQLASALDSIAQRIESGTRGFYLLSYCSPARAGQHEVRVKAVVPTEDGKGERSGSVRTKVDASGFGPGCDPNKVPRPEVAKAGAAAGATEGTKGADKPGGKGREEPGQVDAKKGDAKKGDAKKGPAPVKPPADPQR